MNNKVTGSLGAGINAQNNYKLIIKMLVWCNLLHVVFWTFQLSFEPSSAKIIHSLLHNHQIICRMGWDLLRTIANPVFQGQWWIKWSVHIACLKLMSLNRIRKLIFLSFWISTNTHPGNRIQEEKPLTIALETSGTNAYYKKRFLV